MKNVVRSVIFSSLLLVLLLTSVAALAQGPMVDNDHLIAPADLAKSLQSKVGAPLILNVGPRMLYMQAHIPGAEFIGPASDPRGLEMLKSRVKSEPKTKSIVLYCGCCPWSHCPNIEPAVKALVAMGFKNVKALYIRDNFGTDWVYKGYPTVRGQ